ncbi:hypothetical protein [Priestia megaterium]|uniref:hypothetical protein n=1 Tax=Priestia megaterium TaxID=1404 RepID=UPI001ADFFC5F|nr:hypothetical protein [Priestia megaterium]
MGYGEFPTREELDEAEVDYTIWMKEVREELENQSDRAIAVICASILDYQLGKILSSFVIEENEKKIRKELFEGSDSPFSSFGAKIKACYFFGLISQDEYDNIENIRKIRNVFAHQLTNVSFEKNASIKARCENLYIPKNRFVPDDFPPLLSNGELPKVNLDPFTGDNSPKNRYVQLFYYLSSNFDYRAYRISLERREKYEHKLSTADEYRESVETYLRGKEALRKIQESQDNVNIEEPRLMKFTDKYVDTMIYIADVLENSYIK